jgi:hypothetical protein
MTGEKSSRIAIYHNRVRNGAAFRIAAFATVATALLFSTSFAIPDVAGAVSATPSLKITPSEIYYPCSEGNVKFAVKGFAADRKVKLNSGSATGPTVATIKTNSAGRGSTTLNFNNVPAGSYPYYAVQKSTTATATLTIGDCP